MGWPGCSDCRANGLHLIPCPVHAIHHAPFQAPEVPSALVLKESTRGAGPGASAAALQERRPFSFTSTAASDRKDPEPGGTPALPVPSHT